ncbi:MAG TPA: AMP-binding protein [Streptosporangiaceae bacterium]|nr:AMP-binding protein [Streptosporangiaceae bacterium]
MTPGAGADDLLSLVSAACAADPDRPVLLFEDGVVVTRGRLWAEVESFAGYLRSRVEPGERVAVMMPNRAEFMITWLAAVSCRAVLVSLNPAARSHDAGHILRDSEARVAVVSQEHEALFRDLQPVCPALQEIVVADGQEPGGLAAYAGAPPGPRAAEAGGDITNVYYTSGTTGPPKGCMVGHDYWLRFTDLVIDLYGITAADRMLCCLQFFYNDPPWQLLVALRAGTTLVVMRRFSVSRYWPVVRAHGVTVLFGIASTASLLLKAPPGPGDRDHQVRLAIQVGIVAPLHQELVARWGVPWVEAYGLTETGLVTAVPLESAEQLVGSGSIGLPCPGADVRIAGASGAEVAQGEVGEIVVRAPGLMRGYLNRPDVTAETWRGGWLHTGDLGRRDDRGYLYFQGRMKDIIRRAGENIAAAEVETVLRSHPGVLEVAAVPTPDGLRGEEVKVHVLLADGQTPESVSPADLIAFSADRLARYKVPRFVEYRVGDFDRTPSMRVKKESLDRSSDSDRVWDRARWLGW